MSHVEPFRALRPGPENVKQVSSPPYDVVTTAEVREYIRGNPLSLLRISRSEAEFENLDDPYSTKVYEQAGRNFAGFIRDNILVQDKNPGFYIYSQRCSTHTQTGLVCGASIDEYFSGGIKKHEKTRKDKEEDRTRHIDILDANLEPVFLFFRSAAGLGEIFRQIMDSCRPVYDFSSEDDHVLHRLWPVFETDKILEIQKFFSGVDALYIADGHHRAASAAKICRNRRENNPLHTGKEAYNFMLSVIFPSDELSILPYHRLVRDLNGLSAKVFIEKLSAAFEVLPSAGHVMPDSARRFGLFMDNNWHVLKARPEIINEKDSVQSLDASILQINVLDRILGIQDPRTDKRIDFMGGSCTVAALEERVRNGEMKAAFTLHATSIGALQAVADDGLLMPPKSTWFHPKLRSGLFIHRF